MYTRCPENDISPDQLDKLRFFRQDFNITRVGLSVCGSRSGSPMYNWPRTVDPARRCTAVLTYVQGHDSRADDETEIEAMLKNENTTTKNIIIQREPNWVRERVIIMSMPFIGVPREGPFECTRFGCGPTKAIRSGCTSQK